MAGLIPTGEWRNRAREVVVEVRGEGDQGFGGSGAGNREGWPGLGGTNAGGGVARARLGTSSRTKEKEEGKTKLASGTS